MTRLPADHFTSKVVGVSFVDNYPENLLALSIAMDERPPEHLEEPLPAVLKRNPDNVHDANAIEIHVPQLGDYGMIGHLPRDLAARLAPELDEGGRWQAGVASVLINPEHLDRPGISIDLRRVTA